MNKNLHYKISLVFLLGSLWSCPLLLAQTGGGDCPPGTMRYYYDADGDGFGRISVSGCYDHWPQNYVPFAGDCDDTDPAIHPNTVWYEDQDGDGLGDPHSSIRQCLAPRGYVLNKDDACPYQWADTRDGCPEPEPDPGPDPVGPHLSTENYVFTRVYRKALRDSSEIASRGDVMERVTYFDGLGRPRQHIGIEQAADGSWEDVVTPVEYDAFGREHKVYLPYPEASGNAGSFRSGDLAQKAADYHTGTYPGDFTTAVNPYSERHFEDSQLSRLKEVGAPGSDWQVVKSSDHDHTVKYEYRTNTASELRLYLVDLSNGIDSPTLTSSGYYQEGALFKTVTRDENWQPGQTFPKDHTREEFTDKQGRVVLRRTYNQNNAHDTYYVYDDYGNLTYVLPPGADATAGMPTPTQLHELCYQYKYDGRERLIQRKVPGKGWEYIVYNPLDQPVLTQDALQRQNKVWLVTKYDALGRVAYTGKKISSHTQKSFQALVDAHPGYETRTSIGTVQGGTMVYYSADATPLDMDQVYTIHYYDDYDNLDIGFAIPNQTSLGTTIEKGIAAKGFPTLTRLRVLGTDHWITTAMGYDKKGREIWRKRVNPFLSTQETVEHDLDFGGNILQTKTTHHRDGQSPIVVVDHFEYDHGNRLSRHTRTLAGNTELIAQNTYDALGNLITKDVGNRPESPLQKIEYQYNVRGWLIGINDINSTHKLFNFKISYNNPLTGTPLYNGNISRTDWRTNNDDNSVKFYQYSYDALNRIVTATDNTGNYNVSGITYDQNGNLLSLARKGAINESASSFGNMDNLSYLYHTESNQLKAVNDSGHSEYGFKEGSSAQIHYTYDANGNLTSDAHKGISQITYNHLNLPASITIGGEVIEYTYDATGDKLRKELPGKTTDYVSNFIYENGILQFFPHPQGYVSNDNGQFHYVYHYEDHLGNIRLSYTDANGDGVIDSSTEILQEKNYYPFGLQHKGYNNTIVGTENNYQTYQGKEEEKELGKNTYAFGWRDYDAAIGRFNKVDRFAEKYYSKSPYGFSANNPIRLIEVQGDSLWISFGKNNENKVLYQDGNLLNSDGTAYTGDGVKIKKDGSVKIKNSFLKKTVKALNAIGGTDTGGDMLADLQGSDFNFTVNDAKFNPKDAGHNMFLADNTVNAHFWEGMATGQGYFTDIGSGGNIYWNASDPAYGTLTEVGGNRRFRPTTNLAHELVHGWDANTGNLDGRPGTPGGLSRKEYRASYYENQIRGQLGTPLRSIYRYQGNNYNLLNNNQPIFYSKPSIELMIAN